MAMLSLPSSSKRAFFATRCLAVKRPLRRSFAFAPLSCAIIYGLDCVNNVLEGTLKVDRMWCCLRGRNGKLWICT